MAEVAESRRYIVSGVAGKSVSRRHDLSKPQGVRGRNSDNSLLRKVLHWEPPTTLEDGLAKTYAWIDGELGKRNRIGSATATGAAI